jgi:hypothetical protein
MEALVKDPSEFLDRPKIGIIDEEFDTSDGVEAAPTVDGRTCPANGTAPAPDVPAGGCTATGELTRLH